MSPKSAVRAVPGRGFVVRAPALPVSMAREWADQITSEALDENADGFEDAVKRDWEALRGWLELKARRPDVQEALRLSSPDLSEAIAGAAVAGSDRRDKRAVYALAKYFMRMCGRSTPFGTFAGCVGGLIADETIVDLGDGLARRRCVRLDTDFLWSIVDDLIKEDAIVSAVLFFPNSSLYPAGPQWRYAEGGVTPAGRRYQLVSVDRTDYLDRVLIAAQSGARLADLAPLLVTTDVSLEEATDYLRALVDAQLLVPSLHPPITGVRPDVSLLGHLKEIVPSHRITGVLQQLIDAMAELEGGVTGDDLEAYDRLAHLARGLRPDAKHTLQVDMYWRTSRLTVASSTVASLIQAAEALAKITPFEPNDTMRRFAVAFADHYGAREVPLTELFDGAGPATFGGSRSMATDDGVLLREISLVSPRQSPAASPWREREDHLFRLLLRSRERGVTVLELSEADIDTMATQTPTPLPPAYSLSGTLLARQTEWDEATPRAYLKAAIGPSGANMLGRFASGDAGISDCVRSHLAQEEAGQPDAIFAEVVHLPDGRMGNVVQRPLFRGYEIPYLGRSGADPEHQLPVTDLMVSVSGERVVLRSRRLGKQVIPRLTNAHNYAHPRALPIYRFLCSLQLQDSNAGIMWQWGPLETADFLPRVVYRSVVLSLARWRLSKTEIEELNAVTSVARLRAMRRLRKARQIPRWVILTEGEDGLLLDLANTICVDVLAQLVRGREVASLSEPAATEGHEIAVSSTGSHSHEFVIPIVSESPRPGPISPRPDLSGARLRYAPGDRWAYAKLYVEPALGDAVVRRVIGPAIERLRGSGSIDRWFFIRYADPEWHLRLRCRCVPGRAVEVRQVVEKAAASMMTEGSLWRFQWDTFDPEVARYGGADGLEICERIFEIDSDAVLEIAQLELAAELSPGDHRWKAGLVGIDQLAQGAGLASDALAVVDDLRRAFGGEFDTRSGFAKEQLSRKARELRGRLTSVGSFLAGEAAVWEEVFATRGSRLGPVMSELRDLPYCRDNPVQYRAIVGSCIHMHVNRLLRAAHRPQEFILYDFMARHYRSLLARATATV